MQRRYGLVDGDLFHRRVHQLGVLLYEDGMARHSVSVLLRTPSIGRKKSFNELQIANLVEQMRVLDKAVGFSERVQELDALTREAADALIAPPGAPDALAEAGRAAREGRGLMDLIWIESGRRVGKIQPGDYPPRDAAVRDVLSLAIAMEKFVVDWAARQP
jgi:hypothetical protein